MSIRLDFEHVGDGMKTQQIMLGEQRVGRILQYERGPVDVQHYIRGVMATHRIYGSYDDFLRDMMTAWLQREKWI